MPIELAAVAEGCSSSRRGGESPVRPPSTPCGNPPDVDGRYPHSRGMIGAWGYDFRDGTLVDPEDFTDLMTYCRTSDWISDYSFTRATDYRTETPGRDGVARRGAGPGGARWGRGRRTKDRNPPSCWTRAQPCRKGPDRTAWWARTGRERSCSRCASKCRRSPTPKRRVTPASRSPSRCRPNGLRRWLPSPSPARRALRRWHANDPQSSAAALVLDATTRRIQAILHGSPVQAIAADQPMFTSLGTVTLFSRGIPGTEAWRR